MFWKKGIGIGVGRGGGGSRLLLAWGDYLRKCFCVVVAGALDQVKVLGYMEAGNQVRDRGFPEASPFTVSERHRLLI